MARPAFKPTPALRRRVSIAAAAGMSHQEIAIGLGIAKMTLEKHFVADLSIGANARRLEIVEALHKSAKGGSVAAAKAFLAMQPALAPPPAEIDEPARPVGKKQEQNAAAQVAHVDTGWAAIVNPTSPKAVN